MKSAASLTILIICMGLCHLKNFLIGTGNGAEIGTDYSDYSDYEEGRYIPNDNIG